MGRTELVVAETEMWEEVGHYLGSEHLIDFWGMVSHGTVSPSACP